MGKTLQGVLLGLLIIIVCLAIPAVFVFLVRKRNLREKNEACASGWRFGKLGAFKTQGFTLYRLGYLEGLSKERYGIVSEAGEKVGEMEVNIPGTRLNLACGSKNMEIILKRRILATAVYLSDQGKEVEICSDLTKRPVHLLGKSYFINRDITGDATIVLDGSVIGQSERTGLFSSNIFMALRSDVHLNTVCVLIALASSLSRGG